MKVEKNMTNKKEKFMYLGEISYKAFQLFGFWKPVHWNLKWKIFLYRIYSTLTLIMFILFNISFFVQMFDNHENIEKLMESIFYFCTIFNVFLKLVILFWMRKIFIKSNAMFLTEICQPRDNNEIEIVKEFSRIGR